MHRCRFSGVIPPSQKWAYFLYQHSTARRTLPYPQLIPPPGAVALHSDPASQGRWWRWSSPGTFPCTAGWSNMSSNRLLPDQCMDASIGARKEVEDRRKVRPLESLVPLFYTFILFSIGRAVPRSSWSTWSPACSPCSTWPTLASCLTSLVQTRLVPKYQKISSTSVFSGDLLWLVAHSGQMEKAGVH